MNIIICDDRIDDRKNLSDLLSDYGEKKNYEFAITEYDGAAAAFIGILPVIVLFLFLQKYFIQGMVDSAVK